ncbi:hypothetical protein IWW37_003072 [Coemansia sp. RSA 2050]|nr:hypothetical protein IWW37_003072 [Coemansia sp. RSA 2050]KAJ2736462.1 hypothetical protein IW152_000823 [Coemansia sp. BCRC 34962]
MERLRKLQQLTYPDFFSIIYSALGIPMRMTLGTERALSLFGARAQPRQTREFSYTTLVDPDFADGIQMYHADDLAYSGFSGPGNYAQEHESRERSSGDRSGRGRNRAAAQGCHISTSADCWSSITMLDIKQGVWGVNTLDTDANLGTIRDEDIPRVEGRARQLRRRARRKIASALERARDGWELFLLSLSQVKRRGGVVPGPCFY